MRNPSGFSLSGFDEEERERERDILTMKQIQTQKEILLNLCWPCYVSIRIL